MLLLIYPDIISDILHNNLSSISEKSLNRLPILLGTKLEHYKIPDLPEQEMDKEWRILPFHKTQIWQVWPLFVSMWLFAFVI